MLTGMRWLRSGLVGPWPPPDPSPLSSARRSRDELNPPSAPSSPWGMRPGDAATLRCMPFCPCRRRSTCCSPCRTRCAAATLPCSASASRCCSVTTSLGRKGLPSVARPTSLACCACASARHCASASSSLDSASSCSRSCWRLAPSASSSWARRRCFSLTSVRQPVRSFIVEVLLSALAPSESRAAHAGATRGIRSQACEAGSAATNRDGPSTTVRCKDGVGMDWHPACR